MLTLNDGRSELWQWDTGRTMSVDADCSQVHFSNKVFGRSIDVDVIDGVAIIPDILLQTDKNLNVWAFVGTAENGYTKISKTFKVNRRNKPADYVFTPVEQTTIAEIAAIAQSVRDDADAGLFNGKRGDDGGWYTPSVTQPDANTMRFAFTPSKEGMPAVPPKDIAIPGGGGSGEAGGYYAPAVDADGNLSWTASKADMPAVDGANIKGPKGDTGATGATGPKGDKGDKGDKGADGKSAYRYAVEGGYTGTEAEFAAKLAAEKFANPHALTFTGAVTGSYDGSEAKTINIPSGGEKDWKYEKYVEFSEETAGFEFTAYDDETPFDFTEVEISAALKNAATEGVWGDVTVISDGIAAENKNEKIGGNDGSVSAHTASGKWYFCYLRGHIDAKNKSIEAMSCVDANILYVNAPFFFKKTPIFQKPNYCYSINAEQNHWDTPPTKFTTIKSGMTIGAGSSILIRGR